MYPIKDLGCMEVALKMKVLEPVATSIGSSFEAFTLKQMTEHVTVRFLALAQCFTELGRP